MKLVIIGMLLMLFCQKLSAQTNVGFIAGGLNAHHPDVIDYFKSNLYAFRGEAGADFLLGKKIFAGINYSQDLTPCGKMTIDQNYFYFQSLSLRIGYILK